MLTGLQLRTAAIILIRGAAAVLTQVAGFLSDPAVLHSELARILLVPGHNNSVLVYYPVLPWFGVSCLGMAFGRYLPASEHRGHTAALQAGVACLLVFIVLRLTSVFADFHPPGPGWIGFLNTTKYPPSLGFILMTLGTNLLLLAFFSCLAAKQRVHFRILTIFGQCALFFYTLHLYVYALIGFAFPHGSSPTVMYLCWIAGLLVLYPACLWYGRFKNGRPVGSLWRFF